MRRFVSMAIVLLAASLAVSCSVVSAEDADLYVPLDNNNIADAWAFSPDNRYILSGSWNKSLKLWDSRTGRQVRTFREHRGQIDAVFFSPDGRHAVSAIWEPLIKLWDIETGRELRAFKGHLKSNWSQPFSPDGKKLLCHVNSVLRAFDVETGAESRAINTHQQEIQTVSFSPSGKLSASGSIDGTVKMWNMTSGQAVRSLRAHEEEVEFLSFSKDDAYLLSGSKGKLKLWDISTGKCFREYDGGPPAIFSEDNRTVLLASAWDGALELWDIALDKEIRAFIADRNIKQMSSDGRFVIANDSDARKVVIEVGSGKTVAALKSQESVNQIETILFLPDGKRILAGSQYTGTALWDKTEGKRTRFTSSIGHVGGRKPNAFSSDGRYSIDYPELYDVATGKRVRYLQGMDSVESASFLRKDRAVLVGGSQGSVSLYNCASGKALWTKKLHADGVKVAVSRDNRFFVSGSRDGSLKILKVSTGDELLTLQKKATPIGAVAISPDGKSVVSGGEGGKVRMWNTRAGKLLGTLVGHDGWVRTATFSPDGKIIATAGDDATLKIWDSAKGTEIATMRGHEAAINSVVFSPDGRMIATGGEDGTLRLWSVEGEYEIAKFVHFSEKAWLVVGLHGYYNGSPEGEEFLTLRKGNNVSGIGEYRETFFSPDSIRSILSGTLPEKPSVPIRYVP